MLVRLGRTGRRERVSDFDWLCSGTADGTRARGMD